MANVAVIPCRGGSKGIPLKNIQLVHGIPLVIRTITACLQAGIDEVFVSTDDKTIAHYAIAAGAKIINRPVEIAQDTSSTDEVLSHAVNALFEMHYSTDDNLFLFQATSPFTRASTIEKAIQILEAAPGSGVFTAVEWHGFIWDLQDGFVKPFQHNHLKRQRRQDLTAQVLETGGFYGATLGSFKQSGIRFVDPLIPVIVDRTEALEIDTWDDLEFCNQIGFHQLNRPQKPIKIVFTDFDGVLTDNRVYQGESQELGALISRSDGVAISKLMNRKIPVVIITGESQGPAFGRAAKLNIECIYAEDKLRKIIEYCAENSISLSEVAYVGNDLNDLGPIASCGWTYVPRDANPKVSKFASRVLQTEGGHGVLRELVDSILFK